MRNTKRPVVALAFLVAIAAPANAAPGLKLCQNLYKACMAHVDHRRAVLRGAAETSAPGAPAPEHQGLCMKRLNQALATGVWVDREPLLPVHCAK